MNPACGSVNRSLLSASRFRVCKRRSFISWRLSVGN
jgi:hypothetical protein